MPNAPRTHIYGTTQVLFYAGEYVLQSTSFYAATLLLLCLLVHSVSLLLSCGQVASGGKGEVRNGCKTWCTRRIIAAQEKQG